MSKEQGDRIFMLWHELKKVTEMANAADLADVESILRITADSLVQKYYALGLPTNEELHSLVWDETDWPAKTATYLELKSMLLRAKELEEQKQAEAAEANPAIKSKTA